MQRVRLKHPLFLYRYNNDWVLKVIKSFGLVNVSFLILIIILFLIKRAPLFITEIWKNFSPRHLGIAKTFLFLFINLFLTVLRLLREIEIIYYSVYLFCDIMGLVVHPFFFTYGLIDFLRISQLKNVVKAVTTPWVELLLLLILFLIFEYYFTIIGYVFFYDDYRNECLGKNRAHLLPLPSPAPHP